MLKPAVIAGAVVACLCMATSSEAQLFRRFRAAQQYNIQPQANAPQFPSGFSYPGINAGQVSAGQVPAGPSQTATYYLYRYGTPQRNTAQQVYVPQYNVPQVNTQRFAASQFNANVQRQDCGCNGQQQNFAGQPQQYPQQYYNPYASSTYGPQPTLVPGAVSGASPTVAALPVEQPVGTDSRVVPVSGEGNTTVNGEIIDSAVAPAVEAPSGFDAPAIEAPSQIQGNDIFLNGPEVTAPAGGAATIPGELPESILDTGSGG